MSEILFLGGPPLRPAPGCEGYRYHVLDFRWARGSGNRWRRTIGYWTVGRWYLSGVEQVFSASEGPINCKYVAPLPDPSLGPVVAPWPSMPILGSDDESLHWLLPPRRLWTELPRCKPQPAILAFGLWSLIGDEERFDTAAMLAMGWNYICPAKIGEVPVQHAPKKRSTGQHHPFPPGDPITLGVAGSRPVGLRP